MNILKRFLPKKKPVAIKNNIPKEKNNIKKTFTIYCHSHHGTTDKLCPKCTALLATVMTKMNRCPYGITKPICDRCDISCLGTEQTKEFRKIMGSTQKRMFLRHPIMAAKHKLASMGVDYAKYAQEKKQEKKSEAKEKAAKNRQKKNSTKK